MKSCVRCVNVIELERLDILPNTDYCISCAKIVNPPRVKGHNCYLHKTGGFIEVMDPNYYDKEFKKYNPSFGRGSGVHRMSPRLAGTA